jgi:8-oxo-dGTP diphosphatase
LLRRYPQHPLLGVGGIIMNDDNVLLVRRANPPLQGQWSLPGGLVETGETTQEAVVREVLEETGLQIAPVKLVEVFERILRDEEGQVEYHFVLIDYLCRVTSGDAHAASDVTDVRWAKLDELASLAVAPETCAVIRKAASELLSS